MRLRSVVVLAAAMLATGVQAAKRPPPPPPLPANAAWTLRLPKEASVAFRGLIDTSVAGKTHSMMYPAADPLTFLVALATHGVMNAAAQKAERSGAEEQADKVLAPYQAVIEAYTHRELMLQALALKPAQGQGALQEGAPQGQSWVLESAPVFFMTQDQRALLIDNVVALYAPGSAARPAYANSVRVVSTPLGAADPAPAWLADDGAEIKATAARLTAESFELFLGDVAGQLRSDTPHKTLRYLEGGSERFERAQPVAESCGRVQLKTLRGWLMSVPVASSATCTATAQGAVQAAEPIQGEPSASDATEGDAPAL